MLRTLRTFIDRVRFKSLFHRSLGVAAVNLPQPWTTWGWKRVSRINIRSGLGEKVPEAEIEERSEAYHSGLRRRGG
jgi:hypothetical protein